MARFRNQVSKGIEEKPETRNQNLDNGNQKPDSGKSKLESGSLEPEDGNQKMENGKSNLETKNQKPKTRNQKSEAIEEESQASVIYGESDMEPVNVAGFKVPYVVREHWKKGCREKRVKLSPMLKRILTDEFGLPPGITLDDL